MYYLPTYDAIAYVYFLYCMNIYILLMKCILNAHTDQTEQRLDIADDKFQQLTL